MVVKKEDVAMPSIREPVLNNPVYSELLMEIFEWNHLKKEVYASDEELQFTLKKGRVSLVQQMNRLEQEGFLKVEQIGHQKHYFINEKEFLQQFLKKTDHQLIIDTWHYLQYTRKNNTILTLKSYVGYYGFITKLHPFPKY